MLGRKLKWTILFEDQAELDTLLSEGNPCVYKNMFGDLLLAKDDNKYYAFKNQCPHQRKPLDNSRIENGEIVCPWHQYRYSCETGRGHGLHIEKYPLRIENGVVYIGKEVWTLFG